MGAIRGGGRAQRMRTDLEAERGRVGAHQTVDAVRRNRSVQLAGAVVADRPEQRPLLVVAVASRLEVVVDAPPTPPTEPSAGVERWIGSIKLYRLWLKRRPSCLSPSLGAYGLQDAPPRSGQPNTTS